MATKTPTSSPSQLATPSDLRPEQVQAVCEAVNPIIADAFALYVKTKNFHWHMSGPHFREYHVMLDEQAESILASTEVLAERVRRIGGTTIRSIGHISELQSIDDDDEPYVEPEQMLQRLLIDNRQSQERQRKAIDVCEENRDTATGNRLQEILDETEKRVWFLHEVLQGAVRAGRSQQPERKVA